MHTRITSTIPLSLLTILLSAAPVPLLATSDSNNQPYSPHVDQVFPKKVYWGDTHVHSNLSTDAFGFGVRLGPEAVFQFASGEQVESSWGEPVQLARPLDFVVLADHAESMGLMSRLAAGDKRLIRDATTRRWHALLSGSAEDKAEFRKEFLNREIRTDAFRTLAELTTPEISFEVWRDTLAIAERHNTPGQFTTLLGYEWTSTPGGSNLHRVVVFRDDAERVGKMRPFSSYDSKHPFALWQHLERYEKVTGGRVLAIPHNGNLSNGLMFPAETTTRKRALTRDYAEMRQHWEPIVEVTQIKGDGETHPLLSPDDEFSNYETWDYGNFDGQSKTPDMLPHEYARSALRNGLALERQLGANPYKFGMIGATDSHTGLATAEEDNFFGKHSLLEPKPGRWQQTVGKAKGHLIMGWQQVSSGYAAVWATDNTREALFDALRRREVYATTGSRITVRLFGGWNFTPDDLLHPHRAQIGYRKGVPMGGDLPSNPRPAQAPRFLVMALKDPIGANLDRIQIVKGWLDEDGNTRERVYNVAWSDIEQRKRTDGVLGPVGNTVDITTANYENSIGDVQLQTLWEDPDFDPRYPAFYYARVLEIPTPRWTTYDAVRYGVDMPADVPRETQERAYTSPIWYSPK